MGLEFPTACAPTPSSDGARPCNWKSPFKGPAVSVEELKAVAPEIDCSTELAALTNDCTVVAALDPSAATLTVTGFAETCCSITLTPGSNPVTVFDADETTKPPAPPKLTSAFWPAVVVSIDPRPAPANADGLSETAFAAPVASEVTDSATSFAPTFSACSVTPTLAP